MYDIGHARLKGIMSIVDFTTFLPMCLLGAHLHSLVEQFEMTLS